MARGGGIPGLAVGLTAVGGYLLYVGVRNVSPVEGLRELLRGTAPTGTPPPPAELPEELEFLPGGRAGSGLGNASGSGGPVGSGAGGVGGAAGSGIGGAAGGAIGSGLGHTIAQTAQRYLGVPYRWGGSTPSGWDCSGYVYYVLRECGVSVSRTTAAQYLTWSGAVTVPRPPRPGDLVVTGGHIGIAVSATQMAHAPTFGQRTKIGGLTPGAVIRRVRG